MSFQPGEPPDTDPGAPSSSATRIAPMRVSIDAPAGRPYGSDRHTRPLHRRSASLASLASITSIASLKSVHVPRNLLSRLIIPLIILLSISVASAAQTEAAHYLLVEVNYNQPYFAFFLTHVSFAFVFPLHLLVLLILRPSVSPLSYLPRICKVIAEQMDLPPTSTWSDIGPGWIKKSVGMTILISLPALSWFIAVVFTTAMDVTTLYATSSFYAYFFSMMLLKQPLSRITVASICLAFGGVLVIVLAGASNKDEESEDGGARNRVLGDIVMTGGAVFLGLYEVVYKLALPEGHGGVSSDGTSLSTPEDYTELPVHAEHAEEFELSPPLSPEPNDARDGGPTLTSSRSDDIPMQQSNHYIHPKASATPLLRPRSTSPAPSESSDSSPHKSSHPSPELPAALLANFLTTSIGLTTIALLWIPIPILHYLGWETFRWPGSQGGPLLEIWGDLQVVAWGGAIYNAGLMILIGIWGPTTSSVANLLTIGLVAVFDAVWGGHVPDFQTLAGVGMICLGFGVLLWEGEG